MTLGRVVFDGGTHQKLVVVPALSVASEGALPCVPTRCHLGFVLGSDVYQSAQAAGVHKL